MKYVDFIASKNVLIKTVTIMIIQIKKKVSHEYPDESAEASYCLVNENYQHQIQGVVVIFFYIFVHFHQE